MTIATESFLQCPYECKYCLPAGTRILMLNHQWKPIERLKEGEEIIGVKKIDGKWKFTRGKVIALSSREALTFKLITEQGSIELTSDHPYLTSKGWRTIERVLPCKLRGRSLNKIKRPFIPIDNQEETLSYKKGYLAGLIDGDGLLRQYNYKDNLTYYRFRIALKDEQALERATSYLKELGINVKQYQFQQNMRAIYREDHSSFKILSELVSNEGDREWKRGYLAGIFDAEGSFSHNILRISNSNEEILERIHDYLSLFNFESVIERHKAHCPTVRLKGDRKEKQRFFALTQPSILRKMSFDGLRPKKSEAIIDIKKGGIKTVYNLQTDIETFIAEGYILHNCFIKQSGWYSTPPKFKLHKIIDTIAKLARECPAHDIVLHGGEPTTYPKRVFNKILELGYIMRGQSSIQTGAYNIKDWQIKAFKKYNTHVSVSVDGPPICNALRGKGSKQKRIAMGKSVLHNIYRLREEGIPVSIISVIHKLNAVKYRELYKKWLLDLKSIGITHGRMNLACITNNMPNREWELTVEEAIDFYTDLYYFCKEHNLHYSPFIDIADRLRGKDAVCIFGRCDPFNTPSIHAIRYDGVDTNCTKLYHNEPPFPRAKDYRPDIREKLLLETDCNGCRWWQSCLGGCPNHGINSDWRRKDKFCPVWKALFELIYNDIQPRPSGSIEHLDGACRHMDGYL